MLAVQGWPCWVKVTGSTAEAAHNLFGEFVHKGVGF